MKYVIVIPDGAADEPQESLGARLRSRPRGQRNRNRPPPLAGAGGLALSPLPLPAGPGFAISVCWVTTRLKTSPVGRRWKRRRRGSSLGRRIGRFAAIS